jgi:environmental stress-induced protein Ves
MSPTIVRYAQQASMPWKNGLGATTQLAIFPAAATLESFEWRISIARLDQSAPFSLFPGIERWLATLEGEMVLLREGFAPSRMTSESAPIRFSGETPSAGQVVRGPVLDLNVMYRASRWNAMMHCVRGTDAREIALAAHSVVCSRSPSLVVELKSAHLELGRYDALHVAEGCTARIFDAGQVEAYLIALQER